VKIGSVYVNRRPNDPRSILHYRTYLKYLSVFETFFANVDEIFPLECVDVWGGGVLLKIFTQSPLQIARGQRLWGYGKNGPGKKGPTGYKGVK